MATNLKWREAVQYYNQGLVLYRENRFEQALTELRRAADAFRKLDARGTFLHRCLPNGVSGQANALVLTGQCHFHLGEFEQAVTCFETALINEQFEDPASFQKVQSNIRADIIACYAALVQKINPDTLSLQSYYPIEIDSTFRFPFSLPRDLVPLARLYELAPEHYAHYAEFYQRAWKTHEELRRADKDLDIDGSRMHKATRSIWTLLGVLWTIYTIIVFKALFPNAFSAIMAP